jgi:hypothetical protein
LALLFLTLVAAAGPHPAAAQQGISCDPSVRVDNPNCPNNTVCRRFAASCWGLGVLCNDSANSNSASVPEWLAGVCSLACSAGFGMCEDRAVACDSDETCGTAERCMIGVCTYVPRRCSADTDCADGEACVNFRCQGDGGDEPLADRTCASDDDCPESEACFTERCFPRCEVTEPKEGEGGDKAQDQDPAAASGGCPENTACVDGVCRPI